EDDPDGARPEFEKRGLNERDLVFGIAAGGTTPYVHGGLKAAKERGAATIFFACVPRDDAPDEADLSIRVITGPEALAGSTRLKAGTATKRVLNMVTTLAMARLGKVHENLMVDVHTKSNAKLVERGVSLIARISGVSREEARALLEAADGHVKTACVMHAHDEDAAAAKARLVRCGDTLRAALE
ncbi:MAG: N-acetylmuramic acid 6-phosphate etherase, partial [Planctomycetota bacterium]